MEKKNSPPFRRAPDSGVPGRGAAVTACARLALPRVTRCPRRNIGAGIRLVACVGLRAGRRLAAAAGGRNHRHHRHGCDYESRCQGGWLANGFGHEKHSRLRHRSFSKLAPVVNRCDRGFNSKPARFVVVHWRWRPKGSGCIGIARTDPNSSRLVSTKSPAGARSSGRFCIGPFRSLCLRRRNRKWPRRRRCTGPRRPMQPGTHTGIPSPSAFQQGRSDNASPGNRQSCCLRNKFPPASSRRTGTVGSRPRQVRSLRHRSSFDSSCLRSRTRTTRHKSTQECKGWSHPRRRRSYLPSHPRRRRLNQPSHLRHFDPKRLVRLHRLRHRRWHPLDRSVLAWSRRQTHRRRTTLTQRQPARQRITLASRSTSHIRDGYQAWDALWSTTGQFLRCRAGGQSVKWLRVKRTWDTQHQGFVLEGSRVQESAAHWPEQHSSPLRQYASGIFQPLPTQHRYVLVHVSPAPQS